MMSLNRILLIPARRAVARSLSSSADEKRLIINALGTDRLGIVSDMTREVVENGGSVGESQALKLGASFSITMSVSVPNENVDALTSSLTSLEDLTTHFIESDDDGPSPSAPAAVPGYVGRFVLQGSDHAGIVHKVTSLLNKHGLSIDAMEAMEEDAPFGGTTLFHLDGIAAMPHPLRKDFNSDMVRKELRSLGESFNCDADLIDNVGRKDRMTDDVWQNVA